MNDNKQLIRRRFEASFERYNALATVQRQICRELAEAIERYLPGDVGRGLEIGAGTGFLTRHLVRIFPDARWAVNDLAPTIRRFTDPYLDPERDGYLIGDAETIDLRGPYDLIAAASTVQWFDDLPRFLHRAAEAVRSGGHLALTTFGTENFREIRTATGEGLVYFPMEQLQKMLSGSGFECIWLREYCEKMWFDTPVEVLRHIKATGVNSLRGEPWTRSRLESFGRRYRDAFADGVGDRVPLTYHPILIVARLA